MTTLPINDAMGWLQKLLLYLCLPLSSSVYASRATAIAIATAQPTSFQQQVSQTVPTAVPLNSIPVTKQQLPHLTHSSSCTLSPAAASFNSQQLDQQLQRYLRFVAQFGKPDILIVGSSRALQGIDPIVLQQTLANQGYPALKIFNLGVNGATVQLVDLLLYQILTADQLPRLILWGDGVRAFNSGRVDLTYNRAIASQSYQLLTAGIRPTLQPVEPPIALTCAVISLKRFDYTATSQPKYFDFVPYFTSTSKSQPLHRELLLQPALPTVLENPAIARLQETTGFHPLFDQFKPESYFQRYPRVPGDYDADYRNFSLEGKQTEAFNHLLEFAKARQIPVIFVNLPLTQIYLDEARTKREAQFHLYLQRFKQSYALSVYNLSQRWLNQHAYFTDPSHLNRYGAAAVAAELGRTLVIPKTWLQIHRQDNSSTYKP